MSTNNEPTSTEELVSYLAGQFPMIAKSQLDMILRVIMLRITGSLRGQLAAGVPLPRISVLGLGTLTLRRHPPRKVYNPKTGERTTTGVRYSSRWVPPTEFRTNVTERWRGSKSKKD